MSHIDRVAAFLAAYPHDGSSNLDREVIYRFNDHELRWSDLDALVADAREAPDMRSVVLPDAFDQFEQFWQAYPRRVGKKEAFKAWSKLNGDQRQLALDVIGGHIQMWVAEGRGTRLIPHASTWLNQWRFDDEIAYVPERDTSPRPENRNTRTTDVLNRMQGVHDERNQP